MSFGSWLVEAGVLARLSQGQLVSHSRAQLRPSPMASSDVLMTPGAYDLGEWAPEPFQGLA